MTEFKDRLRALRRKSGLTQIELAKKIDVSNLTVFRWEAGERSPRMEEVRRIASALHVTEDELLNGPKEKK